MAVITVSRLFGAGGWTLGQRLAKTLGYRYVDERMINEIAEKIGVTKECIRAFEQEGATRLNKFLDMVVSRNFIDRHVSNKSGYVDEKRYTGAVEAILHELHKQDNVVIVGRAGQYILKGFKGVWRIFLVDNMEDRIRMVSKTHKVSESDAERLIRTKDRIRTNFLSFFADPSTHEDPRSYDLTLNMEHISLEKAERLILTLLDR